MFTARYKDSCECMGATHSVLTIPDRGFEQNWPLKQKNLKSSGPVLSPRGGVWVERTSSLRSEWRWQVYGRDSVCGRGGGVSKDDCLSVERKNKKVSLRRIARTLAHWVTIVVATCCLHQNQQWPPLQWPKQTNSKSFTDGGLGEPRIVIPVK